MSRRSWSLSQRLVPTWASPSPGYDGFSRGRGSSPLLIAGDQVAAQAAYVGINALEVGFPFAGVADDGRVEIGTLESSLHFDGSVLAQHEVMRARARGQLAVVSVPRPGGGKDLALDLLHSGDVGLSHELESQLLSYLNHH